MANGHRVPRAVVRVGRWLPLLVSLTLLAPGSLLAQEPCQGKRQVDPRSARLQVMDLRVTSQGVMGRMRNTASDTALGAMLWVNYYATRRGGPKGQQCIPVGDLQPGEERAFGAPIIPEAGGSESFDYAADAAGWR